MQLNLNSKQAAYLLGITDGTLRHWRCIGKGPKWTKAGNGLISYERT